MAASHSASPPAYVTKRQYAADRLREMIVAGDLPEGSQVRQQTVAQLLGISATPVREAIWQLRSEGYLESVAHVGFRVSPAHRQWFPEVLELRLDLEGRLARIAAQTADDREVHALEGLDQDFSRAVADLDVREARRVNFRIHNHIWEAARQPLTQAIVALLWAKYPRTGLDRIDLRGPVEVAEHHAIVRAIAERDGAGAEAAMRRHVNSIADWHGRPEASPPSGLGAPGFSSP